MSETPAAIKPVLQLENFRLVFKTQYFQPSSWRDAFTRVVRNPMELLTGPEEDATEKLFIARDINLSVYPGDRIALLGINGAGKTSLCRCIAGMYRPDAGKVIRNGQVRAIFDTHIGVQPELTGRENGELLSHFLFPLHPRRQELLDESLAFTELGKFLDTPFKFYSNGMKTRLCLSVVSAIPSDVLILDEVFEGADAYFSQKAAERVLGIMRKSGAVIFVSHSEDQVRRACNRTVVLHEGRIAFDGDVEEGLARYNELRPGGAPRIRAVVSE